MITVDAIHINEDIEQGAEIGLIWLNTILQAASGKETAIQNWECAKHQGTFNYGVLDAATAAEIKAFVTGRRGTARGFLLKNYTDYIISRQQIFVGDGATLKFPLLKTYPDSVNPYAHIITRPIISTLQVWVNGVLKASPADYSFSNSQGIVFVGAPGNTLIGEAACEFDLPMRFTADYMPFQVAHPDAISVPAFGMIELEEYEPT